ncbi:MAG: MCP four helix bundle domain-containing protein [Bacillota bacterium]
MSKRGMGIQIKMIMAFAAVLVLLTIVGGAGILGLRSVGGGYKAMVDGDIEILEGLLEIRGTALEHLVAVREHVLTGDEAAVEWYRW